MSKKVPSLMYVARKPIYCEKVRKQLELLGISVIDEALKKQAEDDYRKAIARFWATSPMDEHKGDGFLKLLSDE